MSLAPLIDVSYVKNLTACYKEIGKCIFVRFLGCHNCLPDKKMALEKALPNRNLALKSLTKRESGHQIFLPDMIFLTGKIYDYFNSV